MFKNIWNKYEAQIISISKGALVAAAGAAITYGLDATAAIDFGAYTELVVAVNSVIVNIARKFGIPVIVGLVSGK
jgi:hypothetical protein